jgi:hypothetical protein
VKDWKAELDTFFRQREQQEQEQHTQAQPPRVEAAIAEFMVAVATPAFEEFGAALREHGCHIQLRLGDSNMRIVSEYAGREEFDHTLWAGTRELFAESRTGGRRTPDSFHNAKGNSAIADTTQEDIVRHLADRYIALPLHVSA